MNTGNLNSHCCSKRSPIRKWLIGRRLRKLKLDNSQIEKLDELFANARSASNGHVIANSELQQHISAIMAEDGFNREKAVELVRTIADQYAERATEIVEAFGEFYQGLEPWQREQIRGMWQKRRHCAARCCH
jgi:Spy/CpxP family protein refolding chaperone